MPILSPNDKSKINVLFSGILKVNRVAHYGDGLHLLPLQDNFCTIVYHDEDQ